MDTLPIPPSDSWLVKEVQGFKQGQRPSSPFSLPVHGAVTGWCCFNRAGSPGSALPGGGGLLVRVRPTITVAQIRQTEKGHKHAVVGEQNQSGLCHSLSGARRLSSFQVRKTDDELSQESGRAYSGLASLSGLWSNRAEVSQGPCPIRSQYRIRWGKGVCVLKRGQQ